MTPYYEQDGITIYYGDCIEIEERYCEIAAQRLSQTVLAL